MVCTTCGVALTVPKRYQWPAARRALRDEDALAREGRVGLRLGVAVRASVPDLDLAQLPDRARLLLDCTRHERLDRRVDGAGGPDRGVDGRRARNEEREWNVGDCA